MSEAKEEEGSERRREKALAEDQEEEGFEEMEERKGFATGTGEGRLEKKRGSFCIDSGREGLGQKEGKALTKAWEGFCAGYGSRKMALTLAEGRPG